MAGMCRWLEACGHSGMRTCVHEDMCTCEHVGMKCLRWPVRRMGWSASSSHASGCRRGAHAWWSVRQHFRSGAYLLPRSSSMKTWYILLFLCLGGQRAFAQNLVPNGSFEEYTECPDNWNQVARATGWYSLNPTVDYYNACSGNAVTMGVPNNAAGYQVPFNGTGYAGLITFYPPNSTPNPDDSKEIIGIGLVEPLAVGVPTYMSFRASPTTGGFEESVKWTCEGIGMRFRNSVEYDPLAPHAQSVPLALELVPTDTAAWILISGEYLPDSAYSYLQLGNFFSDSLLHPLLLNPMGNREYAYMYVDDVCVSQVPGVCAFSVGMVDHGPSSIKVYPSVFEEHFYIKQTTSQGELVLVELLDMSGRVCFKRTFTMNGVVDVFPGTLSAGSYMLKVSTEESPLYQGVLFHKSK